MQNPTTNQLIQTAWQAGKVVPGFNIPYLPMMEPVVRALRDANVFGLIMVARVEWIKFESKSLDAVKKEYDRYKDERHTRLHLDHVPVIDEDGNRVDYESIIKRAIDAGYDSVMLDGSRLSLEKNIECTARVVDLAHNAGMAAEAELGAVWGHEAGPMPPYEQLYNTGKGFTDPDQAGKFVQQTDVDWLSVAIGNIHGAVSPAKKDLQKIQAKLNIDRLTKIKNKTKIPLVLHGGSGIQKPYIINAIKNGIAKINVGTTIRQAYERNKDHSISDAQNHVYQTIHRTIETEFEITHLLQP